MENSNTISIWPPIILIFFVVVMFGCFIYLTVIKDYIKNKKIKIVKVEAVNGNKYALEMIRHPSFFKDEDEEIIRKALDGNINALKTMGYYNFKEEN